MTVFFSIIKNFYQENTILSLYFITILIFMVMEILFLIKSNWVIYKIKKKLIRNNFKKGDILTQIKEEYKKLLKASPGNIDNYTFIKNMLEKNKKKVFRGIDFIENSASLYILLGFLGAVFIIANSLLGLEFDGLESLGNIYSNLDIIFITIVFALICSLIIKIITYVFNTREKIDLLIEDITEYLQIEIKPYTDNSNREIKVIQKLIEKLEDKLSDIEKTIDRGFKGLAVTKKETNNDSLNELKIMHTADIHAGLNFTGYPDEISKQLAEARFEILERLVNVANIEGCNLFAIAGDLFEDLNTDKKDIIRVLDILNSYKGQVVLVLPGNHDYYNENEEIEMWTTFKNNMAENIVVLNEYRPYKLNEFGLEATIYPAYCDSRDGYENKLKWIKNIDNTNKNLWQIGIAHGAIKDKFPEMTYNYFVMSEEELKDIDMDIWLLGHTHEPYPEQGIIKNKKIFNPGTPEPDSKKRKNNGNAWLITIDRKKAITAMSLQTGKYKSLINKEKIKKADH